MSSKGTIRHFTLQECGTQSSGSKYHGARFEKASFRALLHGHSLGKKRLSFRDSDGLQAGSLSCARQSCCRQQIGRTDLCASLFSFCLSLPHFICHVLLMCSHLKWELWIQNNPFWVFCLFCGGVVLFFLTTWTYPNKLLSHLKMAFACTSPAVLDSCCSWELQTLTTSKEMT